MPQTPALIDCLNWRYATKKMNPGKRVSQEKVERILEAAEDDSMAVRSTVARILVLIPDEETIAVLKRMAAGDPGLFRGQGENGGDLYPVRRRAAESLRQIEEVEAVGRAE